MLSYPQVVARACDTPLMLLPAMADGFADVLAHRLGVGMRAARPSVAPPSKPPFAVQDRVAVIPVFGELVNRGSRLTATVGLATYDALAATLREVAADPAVAAIVMEIDSPGGEAAGALELAALVRMVDATKPVVAFVNGMACSAAYAIATGAGTVVVAPSATVGSIGVVLVHLDRTKAMSMAGLKPTLVKKGAFKTDGTALEPLAEGSRDRLQSLVDDMYGLFVGTVARHRPGLTEAAVRATEAGLFIGQQAVSAGLADRVGTLEDAARVAVTRARERKGV